MYKILCAILLIFIYVVPSKAQRICADTFYLKAYQEIRAMLDNQKPLSVKKAVYWSEWAYLGGNLDYEKDFNKEIVRIANYIKEVIALNHFENYKTAKQFSICNYFFRPCNGNGKIPYTYDNKKDYPEDDWHYQLTSRTLKTHTGQCRSLPWTFKLIAEELGADVRIAYAPRHCYVMYKDEDDHYPEDWVNVELTNQSYTPSFSIKEFYCINDSAILASTYMTPLNDRQTIAHQLSDLAMGYLARYNKHYDEFTIACAQTSLKYHEANPTAILILGHSLESLLRNHLSKNGGYRDKFTDDIDAQLLKCHKMLTATYWTEETDELHAKWTNYGKPAPNKQFITREMYNKMNNK